MPQQEYELVVGLEVHAQLLTRSKLFCGDSTAFGSDPNSQVSPISLAHPGTLPRLNEEAILLAARLGIALECDIQRHHYFARKNYFYPDLPKGYQVSQHSAPVCRGGFVGFELDGLTHRVQLNRIHIEEDAGKSIHDIVPDKTCIDLNRAGTPLLEIVTEPCIHSAEEAFQFLTSLRSTLRWLDVCDGNMEEGSMRCDANISVRPVGSEKLGTRVEVKNLNSIRHVRKAIEIEADRLIALCREGKPVKQETRSFDADRQVTFSLRSKEEAEDYRYFPEPDLPPFTITEEYLEAVRADMPKLPAEERRVLEQQFELSSYDAGIICGDKESLAYFYSLVNASVQAKTAANWMLGPLRQYCNEHDCSYNNLPIGVNDLALLIKTVETGQLSFSNASGKVLKRLIEEPGSDPLSIARQLNLIQESDSGAIEAWVDQVIGSMPDKVAEYRKGKKGLIGLFAGEVKKLSGGKADMAAVNKWLAEKLNA